MSYDVLEIIKIETRVTRRGIPFKILTCKEATIFENGSLERKDKIGVRTLWPDRPVQILHQQNHQVINVRWRGDIAFETTAVGDLLSAKIVQFKTTTYRIANIDRTTFDCIIWNLERNEIRIAAKELRYLGYNASPLDSNGLPYNYEATVREVNGIGDIPQDNYENEP